MVATRFVTDQTAPASLAFLRYLIGCCCLLPPVLLSNRVRFARWDLLPIGLLGITQFGILIALLNYALQFIPAGHDLRIARPGGDLPRLRDSTHPTADGRHAMRALKGARFSHEARQSPGFSLTPRDRLRHPPITLRVSVRVGGTVAAPRSLS